MNKAIRSAALEVSILRILKYALNKLVYLPDRIRVASLALVVVEVFP